MLIYINKKDKEKTLYETLITSKIKFLITSPKDFKMTSWFNPETVYILSSLRTKRTIKFLQDNNFEKLHLWEDTTVFARDNFVIELFTKKEYNNLVNSLYPNINKNNSLLTKLIDKLDKLVNDLVDSYLNIYNPNINNKRD